MVSKINDDEKLQERITKLITSFEKNPTFNLEIYQDSIYYSANQSLSAFERYESKKSSSDANFLIGEIQTAIGHAAALSRFFWPSRNQLKNQSKQDVKLRKKRGEMLRKVFEVSDDSALVKRDLRDAWEHLDERVDKFLIESPSFVLVPNCTFASNLGNKQIHHFKALDVENECLVLMNEKYFFAPIKAEVDRIFQKAESLIQ